MSYKDVFVALNEINATYVVPRKYEHLPERAHGGQGDDVDIIVSHDDFHESIVALKNIDYWESSRSGETQPITEYYIDQIKKAIKKPMELPKVFTDFERLKKEINPPKEKEKTYGHLNTKLYKDKKKIDLRNNLAYRSPMNNSRIQVDPSVTTGLLERRERTNCFYTPSAADELAHIITHCIFDKEGDFSDYYEKRTTNLYDIVREDENQLHLFKNLLGEIYYDADELVIKLLNKGEYSKIRSELKKYSDY